MSSQFRSRAALIAVIIAFIIPVIVAKLVLDNRWYQGGVTNQGTMLVPPLELGATLNQALPEGWRVVYLVNADCSQNCQQALYALNQVDAALGRESDRVTPLVITRADLPLHLENTPLVQALVNVDIADALTTLPADQLFIIDPLGNVMLHYASYPEEEAMRTEAKALLSDLRKLLKLSKIG